MLKYNLLLLLIIPALLIPTAFADVTINPVNGSSNSQNPCTDIEYGCFNPGIVTVELGETIIFSNNGNSTFHTFTAGTASNGVTNPFDSGLLAPQSSSEWTANVIGEIPYFCMLHPWTEGLIIVEDIQHIVINEVDTNPPGDDSASISEWIELYNPTDYTIDISGWEIASTTVLKKTLTLSNNSTIQSGEFLIYSYDTVWFTDSNESIELKNENGDVIDKTPLLSDLYNDFKSWQRIYDGYDNDHPSDWKFVVSTAGSSNGKQPSLIPFSITVEEGLEIVGAGKTIVISTTGANATVQFEIITSNGEVIETLSFVASDQGEISLPWLIPNNTPYGIYTITATDNSSNFIQTTFEFGGDNSQLLTPIIEPVLQQKQLNTINNQIKSFEKRVNGLQLTIDYQQDKLDRVTLNNNTERINALTKSVNSLTALHNIYESLLSLTQSQLELYS